MTELHDRSTGTTDHRLDSSDQGDRAAVPVDESGKENWAEDAEPLTRSQYAKLIRQQSAGETREATHDANPDAADAHPDAATDNGHTPEQLPQSETWQQDPDDNHSGADRPANSEPGTGTADHARYELPSEATDLAVNRAPDEADPQDGNEEQNPQFTVVDADTIDRTLGDTTPTGIGLKPTGEQLVDLERDERSRGDAFFHELERDEVLDGLHEELEQYANTAQSILEARPPEGHPVQIVSDSPQMTSVMPAGIDAGAIASAGLMVGVVLVELGHRFHERLKHGNEVS